MHTEYIYGKKIRLLRESKGMSLQALADVIGCSKPHIYEIEKEKATPTIDKLIKIAAFFNVDLNYFSNQGVTDMGQNPILQFFTYEHLPEHLREVSKQFGMLAAWLDEELPDSEEKDAGLRKLLEAKDCAVRSALAV